PPGLASGHTAPPVPPGVSTPPWAPGGPVPLQPAAPGYSPLPGATSPAAPRSGNRFLAGMGWGALFVGIWYAVWLTIFMLFQAPAAAKEHGGGLVMVAVAVAGAVSLFLGALLGALAGLLMAAVNSDDTVGAVIGGALGLILVG